MTRPADAAPTALKADSFGRILLMEQDGQRFVRRDLEATPWWLRLPAWWLARREARALAHLDGMRDTPRLLDWNGRWLDRSFMAGDAMYQRPPHGDLAYFRAARRLLQQVHRHGIAHNDLAKEANWL
ncbi:MAG: serine/threonine protein kinase, partial [Stenotrophomonas maltophilia]